jgi:hypothetical protein
MMSQHGRIDDFGAQGVRGVFEKEHVFEKK